jgi:hypothetical protein
MNALCSPSASGWFNLTSFNEDQSTNQTQRRASFLSSRRKRRRSSLKGRPPSASDKFPLDFAPELKCIMPTKKEKLSATHSDDINVTKKICRAKRKKDFLNSKGTALLSDCSRLPSSSLFSECCEKQAIKLRSTCFVADFVLFLRKQFQFSYGLKKCLSCIISTTSTWNLFTSLTEFA